MPTDRPKKPSLLWLGAWSPLLSSVRAEFDVQQIEEEAKVPTDGPLPFHSFDIPRLLDRAVRAGSSPDLILVWQPSILREYLGLDNLSVPMATYMDDAHCGFPWQSELAPLFDHVLVDVKETIPFFWKVPRERLQWLPLYCPGDPGFLRGCLPETERPIDVSFVGNMKPEVMPLRVTFFEGLAKILPASCRFQFGRGSVSEAYSRSKIVINFSTRPRWSYHANPFLDLDHALGLNFRIFEAMGHGSMLLTDSPSPDIDHFFVAGRHFATYTHNDLAHAREQIMHYLGRAEERIAIAREGWKAVLAAHTAPTRGGELASKLLTFAQGGAAPLQNGRARRYALGRALLRTAIHDPYPPAESRKRMVDDRLDRAEQLLAEVRGEYPLADVLIPLIHAMRGNPKLAGEEWMSAWISSRSPLAAFFLEAFLRWMGDHAAAERLADWRNRSYPKSSMDPCDDREEPSLRELTNIVFQTAPRADTRARIAPAHASTALSTSGKRPFALSHVEG